jgi:hypothetical protein
LPPDFSLCGYPTGFLFLLGFLFIAGAINARNEDDGRSFVDDSSPISSHLAWSLFSLIFGALDYVSDCALAYFLRPTNLCHLDRPGGWQFWVQTIVVVLIPTCLLLTVGAIGTGRPLLAVTMLTGAGPASIPALYGFTIGVHVIFADIPSVIVKSSLINNKLGGTEADYYIWASLIFSSLGIFIKPCYYFSKGVEQISPDA